MAALERLSAAQRSKIRRLSQPRELSPDEEGGELNIVPFLDIVVNILIFVLATVAVTFTSSIETTPPASGSSGVRQSTPDKTLGLNVLIVDEGFSLKVSAGNVAPGCTAIGAGMAIPKKAGSYDFTSLTACAVELKNTSAEYAAETQAFISANPDIDYQTVISVIDSLRTGPKGEVLFPDINFRAPR